MIAIWSLDGASAGIGGLVGFIVGCLVITFAGPGKEG